MGTKERELLESIVSRNRTNHWGSRSFSCRYRRSTRMFGNQQNGHTGSGPVETTDEGVLAFTTSGGTVARMLCRYAIASPPAPTRTITFLQNGSVVRTGISDDGGQMATVGYTADARAKYGPPTNGPFDELDLGVASRLTSLLPADGQIVSVRRLGDDPSLVEVVRDVVEQEVGTRKLGFRHTVVYSLTEGGLARQARWATFGGETPAHTGEGWAEDVRIGRFVAGDRDVFLYTSAVSKSTRGGVLECVVEMHVDESSVQIDVPLGDDLFDFSVKPTDVVVNTDLGLIVQAPGGPPGLIPPDVKAVERPADGKRE